MLLGETLTEFKEFSNSFDAAVSYIIVFAVFTFRCLSNAMEKALCNCVGLFVFQDEGSCSQ